MRSLCSAQKTAKMREQIQEKMREQGLEGLVIQRPENRQYASGFTGSTAVLLLTQQECWIYSDFRYREQIGRQSPAFCYVEAGSAPLQTLCGQLEKLGLKRVGYEQDFMTAEEYLFVQKNSSCEWVPAQGLLATLRSIKTEAEQKKIARAADIACRAYTAILPLITPGVSEKEIAAELEYRMAKLGGEGLAFETIVASGPNSSMPHHAPGARKIQNGDFVTMDFGCKVEGYCSDMTRTVAVGHATEEMRRVYQTVLDAQQKALEALGKIWSCAAVDAVARDLIYGAGFEGCFGHGLGHCLGLEIHEEPRLSPSCSAELQPGMVTSVEPGVYLEGQFGVRIEDICLVLPEGYHNYITVDKDLIIL